MANTFAIILTLATLVTGILWCLERFVWAPARQKRIEQIRQETEGNIDGQVLAKMSKPSSMVESFSSLFPALAIVFVVRSFIYEPFQIPSGSMMPTLLIGDFILVEKFAYGIREPIMNTTLIKTGEPKRGDVVVFKYPKDMRLDFIKRVVGLPGDRVQYDPQEKVLTITPNCAQTASQACESQSVSVAYTPRTDGDFVQAFDMFDQSSAFYTQKELKELKKQVYPVPLELRQETLDNRTHSIYTLPSSITATDGTYKQDNMPAGQWVVPEGHYFVMGDNRDNSEDSRYWGFVPEENLVGRATAIWMSFDKQPDEWPTGVRLNRIGGIE